MASLNEIQAWFAANPGASADQIASVAAANGVSAAQIDQAMNGSNGWNDNAQAYVLQNLPALQQTYGTNFGVAASAPAMGQGALGPVVPGLGVQDYYTQPTPGGYSATASGNPVSATPSVALGAQALTGQQVASEYAKTGGDPAKIAALGASMGATADQIKGFIAAGSGNANYNTDISAWLADPANGLSNQYAFGTDGKLVARSASALGQGGASQAAPTAAGQAQNPMAYQQIRSWFDANPNATPEQIATAAAQNNISAAQIDAAMSGYGNYGWQPTEAQDWARTNQGTLQAKYGTNFGVNPINTPPASQTPNSTTFNTGTTTTNLQPGYYTDTAASIAGGIQDMLGNNGYINSVMGNWYDQPAGTGALGSYSQYDPNKMQDFMNPYVDSVVNEQARLSNQNLFDKVIPGINSTFVGSGQFGSDRNGTFMNNAIRDQDYNLSGLQATTLMNAQNAANTQYADWTKQGATQSQQDFTNWLTQANYPINSLNSMATNTANLRSSQPLASNVTASTADPAQSTSSLTGAQQAALGLGALNTANSSGTLDWLTSGLGSWLNSANGQSTQPSSSSSLGNLDWLTGTGG